MSEAIGEMILPGTYIEVRAEGLIGVGGISVGNVGVAGTANRGPVNKVVTLGSYSEALDTFGSYDRWSDASGATPLTLVRTLEQVFKGGASTVYAVRIADADVAAKTFVVQDAADATVVTLTASSPGTWANDVTASVASDTLTLQFGKNKEIYPLTTADALAAAIKDGSRLVTATVASGAGDKVPAKVAAGENGGPDGAAASTTNLASGLALLATENVNIVAVGGFNSKDAAATVLAHLEATENDGRERIAVMGVSSNDVATIGNELQSNPRLVLVAPGILSDDAARTEANKQVKLPAPYAAALVAGRMATLASHVSLTNKDVAADGLTAYYTRAQQKQLLNNRILVLQKNLGIRVLKGITTDTGAFRQISVRRIVDEAKAGVRIGSNPYIGRLNNARVRAALKATLDGFLSGMVLDEKLVGYTLDVSATRSQEINGIALVTMTLLPTFSIDFVKVIMTLS